MKSYRTYEFKTNLRVYRQVVGLTQGDVARLLGTTQNTISSIERNEYSPTAYLAALICDLFHVSFDKMFYFEYEGIKSSPYTVDNSVDTPEQRARHYQFLRNEAEFLRINDRPVFEVDPDFEDLPFV